MGVEERKHEEGKDLQHEPAVERDLDPRARGNPATEEIRYDPEEFIEEEQKRDGNAVVTKLVKMQDDEHTQRAVGDGKPPIGSRYQCIAANAVHGKGYIAAAVRSGRCAATFCASSIIRFT